MKTLLITLLVLTLGFKLDTTVMADKQESACAGQETMSFEPLNTDYGFQRITDKTKEFIKSSPSIQKLDTNYGYIDGDNFVTLEQIVCLYETYCSQMNIDPNLLLAQVKHESMFNPSAKSSAGAYGWAQFIKSTWRSIMETNEDTRSSVVKSIEAQCKYMYILLQESNHSWEHAMYKYLGAKRKSYVNNILKSYTNFINS